jgi:type IV pilus assembly protein PilE
MTPKPNTSSRHQAAGFTLIEVMVTVVIVAILAGVAIPSYQAYVRRGQLTEAFTTLSDLRVKMEQSYQDNKFYGLNAGSTTCPTFAPLPAFPIAGKNFRVLCTMATSQDFLLTAQGTGGMAIGYEYTLDQRGTKGTTKFDNVASTAVCWLTKPGVCDN